MKRRDFISAGIGLAAMPRLTLAQAAGRIYRLAWFVDVGGPGPRWRAAWRDQLARHGYVEGRNLEFHPVPNWFGDGEKLNAAMREMVEWKPDVIVAQFTFNTRVAQGATSSIPIVFFQVADPVAAGLVRSIGHPGGNTTGVTVHNLTLWPKRLQLVRELLPGARRVAVILDHTFTRDGYPVEFYRELRDVARDLNLQLIEEDISQCPGGFEEAFVKIARSSADIVMPLGPWPSLRVFDYDLVKFQNRHRIPVLGIGPSVGGMHEGLVAQLGADIDEMVAIGAELVAAVLGGAQPGEIPVRRQDRILLVLNLKAAHDLGIKVPRSILKRADRVIQ